MRKRNTPTRRRRRQLNLPEDTWDRIAFLNQVLGLNDEEEIVAKAVRFLDLMIGNVLLEGADLIIINRDGTRERLRP